jgi:error-prone DNA polymerase
VTYPHPSLKPILERTLGVPLFQEQGMRMAMETAGFSGGEADELRRAMGHKRSRDRMAADLSALVNGMVANGIEREVADRLFHMLEGFADYGFPESHAASFALLAYASAYIKCHEPAIFCAAILNVQPMGFYSTEVLVNDARRHDVVVKPVAVNASEWWSFVDESGALRLGFHLMRGMGEAQRENVERALAEGRRSRICSISRAARNSRANRWRISPPAARSHRGMRRGAKRSGRYARSTNARRAANSDARWRSTTSRCRTCSSSPRSNAPRSTSPPPASPTCSRSRTSANSTRNACSPPSGSRRDAEPSRVQDRRTRDHASAPGTAKGFVFLTIEDETGLVNVIVRPERLRAQSPHDPLVGGMQPLGPGRPERLGVSIGSGPGRGRLDVFEGRRPRGRGRVSREGRAPRARTRGGRPLRSTDRSEIVGLFPRWSLRVRGATLFR